MRTAKQRYYEALDKQTTGERVNEQNLSTGGRTVRNNPPEESIAEDAFQSLDTVYQELGMKAFTAVTNCLDMIGRIGSQSSHNAATSPHMDQYMAATERQLTHIINEMNTLKDMLEQRLQAIEASFKRIDRFTIDAFRELEDLRRETEEYRQQEHIMADRGRLAKEEAISLALEAGCRMHEEGKRLTLASVAREAGLKYGQIVYAFGHKDAFFERLERSLQDNGQDASGESEAEQAEQAM